MIYLFCSLTYSNAAYCIIVKFKYDVSKHEIIKRWGKDKQLHDTCTIEYLTFGKIVHIWFQ